jgi:hypothetical protein
MKLPGKMSMESLDFAICGNMSPFQHTLMLSVHLPVKD